MRRCGPGATTAALAADYYAETGHIIATPWQFAAGGDFAYPQTQGERPRGIAASERAARLDFGHSFESVSYMRIAPPSDLPSSKHTPAL